MGDTPVRAYVAHIDVTKPYCYRVDRTDTRTPATLSYGSVSSPDRSVFTASGVAQREVANTRIGHGYRGPARVYVWAHRGDDEHYRAPLPPRDQVAQFDFPVNPLPVPPAVDPVD